MDNTRLRSYDFRCPCCEEPHRRLFEYYVKFAGVLPEDQDIPKDRDVTMIERVSMKDQTVYEDSRSISLGDSTFRCGKCHEFFKFNDKDYSAPILLEGKEKDEAVKKFKPLVVVKRTAVMNSLASLVSLVNQYGCTYDEKENSLVVVDKDGKEFRFKIANQLFDAFYKENPMFDVKKDEQWAFENAEGLNNQK